MDNNQEIILTEEQKAILLNRFNDQNLPIPTIRELTKLIFGQEYDARSKYGVVIRKFLSQTGLNFQQARTWVPKKVIVLSEEQQEVISSNINILKPLEIARLIFQNEKLTNLDVETRTVYKYISTLPSNVSTRVIKKESININDYSPPSTEDQTIRRINKYVPGANLQKNDLNEKNKRDIKNLVSYIHTMRFLDQINTYSKTDERDLFESEFIRCTYDKALTEEEVSQYVIYCAEIIIAKQISKRIQDLEEEQDRQIQENNGRPNMALVETISSLRNEYNQCITRQKTSLKSLQGERKERLKLNNANKGNISDLIMYVISEEKRQHLLKLSAANREKLREEIERIKSLDDIKGEVFGIHPNEIID